MTKKISRLDYKFNNTNTNYYVSFFKKTSSFYHLYKNTIFKGIGYVWKAIRFWFISLIVFFVISYYLLVIRIVPFNKIMFEWICLFMFSYWLISGFVFFIKKYQFGKYTSVIQRFWRRSYILFWAIEGCLFIVFFYFTVNSSSEPFYMFDQIQIHKNHLFSWRMFL